MEIRCHRYIRSNSSSMASTRYLHIEDFVGKDLDIDLVSSGVFAKYHFRNTYWTIPKATNLIKKQIYWFVQNEKYLLNQSQYIQCTLWGLLTFLACTNSTKPHFANLLRYKPSNTTTFFNTVLVADFWHAYFLAAFFDRICMIQKYGQGMYNLNTY